jgi:arachidonate 15-lipoxygenase
MAPSISGLLGRSSESPHEQLDERRRQYRYLAPADNLFAPIAFCEKPPSREDHTLPWLASFMPRYLAISARGRLEGLSEGLQKATFRFDKLEAFRQLLGPRLPRFAEQADSDEAFAYRRIAGGNPIVIRQEPDLARLRRDAIPLDTARIERWLEESRPRGWTGSTDLAAAAKEGRLFVVDYQLIQSALPSGQTRDSRWRGKYAAAPIAVLLEAPGFHAATDLVPVAIQIDQPQPDGAYNPVYYPDDGWGWQIAKLYVEAADASHHLACGHIFRCHLAVEPFCIATPRQLPEGHPVYTLLEPHTQFTLVTNDSVYQYFTDRTKYYFEFYSGNLEETRAIAIQSYWKTGFRELRIDRELASRGVTEAPVDYPYRDDALLWWKPIERFVRRYVRSYYASDREIVDDARLQAWAEELMDPSRGALRDMVQDGRLDSRDKLALLLAQVLYTAGPGHAASHFAGYYFYRYPPAMPSASCMPPPESPEEETRARYLRTLPSIRIGRDQWINSSHGLFRWGRFGHYDDWALGRAEEAKEAIRELQKQLEKVEGTIEARVRARPYRYDFLLPSLVPNSINL